MTEYPQEFKDVSETINIMNAAIASVIEAEIQMHNVHDSYYKTCFKHYSLEDNKATDTYNTTERMRDTIAVLTKMRTEMRIISTAMIEYIERRYPEIIEQIQKEQSQADLANKMGLNS